MLFAPNEHAANPPHTWIVRKHGRRWALCAACSDNPIDTFDTKREAEAAKTTGFFVDLYAKEARWYAGQQVDNWKPYQKAGAA